MTIKGAELLLAGALVAGAAACEPGQGPARDQWVLVIGTDAPIPQLGDRLSVTLVDGSGAPACDGCRRQFAAGELGDWPVSFGILPRADGQEVTVRAVLFRTDHTGFDGNPIGHAHLEAIGRLPAPSGVTRVGMSLMMDCFGLASDSTTSETCDAGSGTLVPPPVLDVIQSDDLLPRPGTWPQAQRVDCGGTAPDGTVCVPGGLFLLGAVQGFGSEELPERLVRVLPFAMDRDEVTVGQVKSLYGALLISEEPKPPDADPLATASACNYIAGAENDTQSVNCLDQQLARDICAARDMRLPTEAEWEWAAGNLERETTYPWGEDDDVCARAIIGRGRRIPNEIALASEPDPCRGGEGTPWGLVPGGSDLDVTELGIRNLAGNLSEWVDDANAPYDDPCWSPELRLLVDPRCAASSNAFGTNRGGGWASFPAQARVFERNSLGSANTAVNLGLRCVKSMAPQ